MLEHFANHIASLLVDNGTISAEDRPIYAYGVQMGVELLANIASTAFIGLLFGAAIESLIFLAGYAFIRSYAGGYHAESALSCYIQSCLLIAVGLLFMKWLPFVWFSPVMIGMGVFAVVVILACAPVPATHKPLDERENVHFRKVCRIRLLIEIIVIGVFILLKQYQWSLIMVTGLFLISVLMLLGMIKNYWYIKRQKADNTVQNI